MTQQRGTSGNAPTHREIAQDIFERQVPAVVQTRHERIEEGHITAIDEGGFRIGPLGHWVWWAEIVRLAEKMR